MVNMKCASTLMRWCSTMPSTVVKDRVIGVAGVSTSPWVRTHRLFSSGRVMLPPAPATKPWRACHAPVSPVRCNSRCNGASVAVVSRYSVRMRSSKRAPISAMEPCNSSVRMATRGELAKATSRGWAVGTTPEARGVGIASADRSADKSAASPVADWVARSIASASANKANCWRSASMRGSTTKNCQPSRTPRHKTMAIRKLFCSFTRNSFTPDRREWL